MRSRYKIIENENIYFITSTIHSWIPIIMDENVFEIIINSFKYCRNTKSLKIYGYVIMPNHFHAFVSHDDLNQIPLIIRDIKRHTSKQI